jgi:hypothetical protein
MIDISKQVPETQSELLQQYLSDYNKVKIIAQSNKIDEKAKEDFLRVAYEKAGTHSKYKMLYEDCLIDIAKQTPEMQSEFLQQLLDYWFNYTAIKSIAQTDKIDEKVKESFLKAAYEKADANYKYKMLYEDCLIDISKQTPQIQFEFLQQYLSELIINNNSKYEQIKSIIQSDKIDEQVKENFLKAAYEKISVDYKHQMMIDGIIALTLETQSELLQQHLVKLGKIERDNSWNVKDKEWKYEKFKSIAQSDKIDEQVKDNFLKAAYKKISVDYKHQMMIDGIIALTPETQSELLQQYLVKLGKIERDNSWNVKDKEWKYEKIKSIAQSDKIDEQVKDNFLKTAYEKANNDYKVRMLRDGIISLIFENQSELLHQYLSELGNIELDFLNRDNKDWKYIKIQLIAKSDKIDKKVKEDFLKAAYEKSSADYKYKMLFDDKLLVFDFIEQIKNYDLLQVLKNKDKDFYHERFEEAYPNISKVDQLYLWLKELNPHYNYFEFVQVAWQLSNDERKLFNKQVKEYAKEERIQKFIDQIPKAELLKGTESSKVYKCKWRNLYYRQGTVQVFLDKTTATEDYRWEVAREEWNLLTQEYFNNRRIEDIIVTVDNNNRILNIEGLDDIEVKIAVAEIRKNGTRERRTAISSSQLTKIIHNVAARNQCINFLASQNSPYNAIDVQELVTEVYGSLRRDVSFLFPIPDGKGNVYLIWESAEFEKSKATHIFKCREENIEESQEKIKDYIEQNIYTRSKLNSPMYADIDERRALNYVCRVNHDSVDYSVWRDRMRTEFPFLLNK